MNTSRFGITLVAAGAVLLSGCAASGAGGGSGGGPVGGGANRPRDTDLTTSAVFFLAQAEAADNPSDRYQQALTAAMNAIREDVTNPQGYYLAGRAHIGLADYAAADSLLATALEMYPGYRQEIAVERESAWIDLFNAALDPLDVGDATTGLALLESAELIFPGQRPEALINIGVTLGNMERYDEAEQAYATALEIIHGPRIEEVDSATAVSWRARVESTTFNRAAILSQAERYDDAAAAYSGYLESVPGDVRALSGLAEVLANAGQADSAQVIYTDLLERSGLGVRDYMNIGVGLYRAAGVQEDTLTARAIYTEAARAFQAAAVISPDNRDAVYNLGQSLFESREWGTLLPVATKLMELDNKNPQSYILLGFAMLSTGDGEEGQRVYQQSDSLDFKIEGHQLQPRTGGGGTATALLTNNTLEPGTPIEIRVHFSGGDGSELGTVDISVDAPARETSQRIVAEFAHDEIALGFYFEIMSPR